MSDKKVVKISTKGDFGDIEEEVENVCELRDDGKLKNFFTAYQFETENGLEVRYIWRGDDSLSVMLGIIEYFKMFLFFTQNVDQLDGEYDG